MTARAAEGKAVPVAAHYLEQPQWLVLFVALVWVVISGLLALLGGWLRLATAFRAEEQVDGEKFRFVSGSLGVRALPVRYNNCFFLTVNDSGFRLSIVLLFRLFCPPLFIPWRAVESVDVRRVLLLRYTVVRLREHWPILSIRGSAGRRIEELYARAAGGTRPA
jgi:hypothetical protein